MTIGVPPGGVCGMDLPRMLVPVRGTSSGLASLCSNSVGKTAAEDVMGSRYCPRPCPCLQSRESCTLIGWVKPQVDHQLRYTCSYRFRRMMAVTPQILRLPNCMA